MIFLFIIESKLYARTSSFMINYIDCKHVNSSSICNTYPIGISTIYQILHIKLMLIHTFLRGLKKLDEKSLGKPSKGRKR